MRLNCPLMVINQYTARYKPEEWSVGFSLSALSFAFPHPATRAPYYHAMRSAPCSMRPFPHLTPRNAHPVTRLLSFRFIQSKIRDLQSAIERPAPRNSTIYSATINKSI